MVMPTPQERALWAKAIASPETLSAEERLVIFRKADSATQTANALEVSGLTPYELEEKALTKNDQLTLKECKLLKNGYHIWNKQEERENNIMKWPYKDYSLSQDAYLALKDTRQNEIDNAVSRRVDHFTKLAFKGINESLAQQKEDANKTRKWMRILLEEPKQPWGFVAYRDVATQNLDDEDWAMFLRRVDERELLGGVFLNGAGEIRPTETLVSPVSFVYERNPGEIRRNFQQRVATGADSSPHILKNTFLLITPEVIESCADTESLTPWIWAYDPDFVSQAEGTPQNGEPQYDGRIKVNLESLFNWFYAVRSEGLYSMFEFWQKALKHPGQVYNVETSAGLYHGPFVLVKGESWPYNVYELDKS